MQTAEFTVDALNKIKTLLVAATKSWKHLTGKMQTNTDTSMAQNLNSITESGMPQLSEVPEYFGGLSLSSAAIQECATAL